MFCCFFSFKFRISVERKCQRMLKTSVVCLFFLYFINFRCATVILLSQLLRTFFRESPCYGYAERDNDSSCRSVCKFVVYITT